MGRGEPIQLQPIRTSTCCFVPLSPKVFREERARSNRYKRGPCKRMESSYCFTRDHRPPTDVFDCWLGLSFRLPMSTKEGRRLGGSCAGMRPPRDFNSLFKVNKMLDSRCERVNISFRPAEIALQSLTYVHRV